MGGLMLRPKVSKKKKVQTPKLTDSVLRQRANTLYTRAVSTIMKSMFSHPPPKSELRGFTALLKAQIKPCVEKFLRTRDRSALSPLDFEKALRKYAKKKPNSILARYYNATNKSSDWFYGRYTFTGKGKIKIIIRFKKSILQRAIKDALIQGKNPFSDTVVKMNNPKIRKSVINMRQLKRLMPVALQRFSKLLIALSKKRNGLPHVDLIYKDSSATLTFISRLKAPEQIFNFSK